MIMYEEASMNDLLNDSTFIDDYNLYQEGNSRILKLRSFIDSIELNKKYFRLAMGSKGSVNNGKGIP
jgi:hypothetical protein